MNYIDYSIVTPKSIKNYPDMGWDWDILSRHPKIPLKFIFSTPKMPWNFKYVSMNPNLTVYDVGNHSSFNWDWKYLSSKFSYEEQDLFPTLPWIETENIKRNNKIYYNMEYENENYYNKEHGLKYKIYEDYMF